VVGGASAETALATAKSRVLMHTTAGVLDAASGKLPAGVPLYAFHDPDDKQTVGYDYKLLNDGLCPRLAVGVPILASKVASAVTKAAAFDQLHPGAAQFGSSSLEVEAGVLQKKAEKVAKKARRLDMEREVNIRMYGASSSSTVSSGSTPAPFTAEEEKWIAKKVGKRTDERLAARAHLELDAARAVRAAEQPSMSEGE
jgi:hypothetical protein